MRQWRLGSWSWGFCNKRLAAIRRNTYSEMELVGPRVSIERFAKRENRNVVNESGLVGLGQDLVRRGRRRRSGGVERLSRFCYCTTTISYIPIGNDTTSCTLVICSFGVGKGG